MIPISASPELPGEKPTRTARTSKRLAEQPSKPAPGRLAKSRDASKVKVTHYIDVDTAMKLAVKAIKLRMDQSDLVNELIGRDVSSIVCFDRAESPPAKSPRAACDNGEDRQVGSAA